MAKSKDKKLIYVNDKVSDEIFTTLKDVLESFEDGEKINVYQYVKTLKIVTEQRLEDVKS
jgi:hypothetical protein